MKVAIIGAGIAGILPAYFLSKNNVRVDVYEEERYPAMKTSYANGGQVSVSNSEVWTTWGNILKGIKWLGKSNAPLLIRPDIDLDKIKWISKFLYHTIKNDADLRTAETIMLGLKSRILYNRIITDENIEFDKSNCGILHFYKDEKYFEHAKKVQKIYVDNGCEWDILYPSEIVDIEPTLESIKNIIGGAWTPSDWTGDIHKFCSNLALVLEKKYNVKFFFNTKINHLNELSTYDYIIIANGVGSVKLAKSLGIKLDLYPVKGYSITINSDNEYLPKVSLLDDQAKIVTSTLGNRLRVAGTAELTGENYDITRERILPLLKWVETNFPNISTENYSSWACLRPMTPTMMPIVGKISKHDNIIFHTGHGHLGWTLSPATANQICNLIINK